MSLLIDLFCMASNSIAIHNGKKNAKDLDAVVTDNRINMRTYIREKGISFFVAYKENFNKYYCIKVDQKASFILHKEGIKEFWFQYKIHKYKE